jgi:hypothetical protein
MSAASHNKAFDFSRGLFTVKHTTYKSMQQYCLHVLRKAIEADIERLTQTGSQRVPRPQDKED